MPYLLHSEGTSFAIIEREYEKDTQTNRYVRLERTIESDLSFPLAKARLRQLIMQKEAEADFFKEQSPAPIGDSPTDNAPSDLMVLQSSAGFYIGRTFDGMPYERVSGYYRTEQDAQASLPLYRS